MFPGVHLRWSSPNLRQSRREGGTTRDAKAASRGSFSLLVQESVEYWTRWKTFYVEVPIPEIVMHRKDWGHWHKKCKRPLNTYFAVNIHEWNVQGCLLDGMTLFMGFPSVVPGKIWNFEEQILFFLLWLLLFWKFFFHWIDAALVFFFLFFALKYSKDVTITFKYLTTKRLPWESVCESAEKRNDICDPAYHYCFFFSTIQYVRDLTIVVVE